MSDMRDDLRELLRRKADQVPPHLEVPRALSGRARRRITVNALGVGLVVSLLVGGAFAGVRAFEDGPVKMPGGSSIPSGDSTPSTTAISDCTSAQLRATASMNGAAGSREGAITLTNISEETCTVQGTPPITLLDQNGSPIITGVTFGSSSAGWAADGSPQPSGWPVVTLPPGGPAQVRVRWSNWCLDGATPQWRIDIPGGGAVIVDGFDVSATPPCNGSGQPSTIDVGPFEPGAGS